MLLLWFSSSLTFPCSVSLAINSNVLSTRLATFIYVAIRTFCSHHKSKPCLLESRYGPLRVHWRRHYSCWSLKKRCHSDESRENPKFQKSKKSKCHDENVGKVKYIGKTRLKIQKQHILDQNHKGPMFLLFFDPRGPPYGALFGPIGPYLPGLGK